MQTARLLASKFLTFLGEDIPRPVFKALVFGTRDNAPATPPPPSPPPRYKLPPTALPTRERDCPGLVTCPIHKLKHSEAGLLFR